MRWKPEDSRSLVRANSWPSGGEAFASGTSVDQCSAEPACVDEAVLNGNVDLSQIDAQSAADETEWFRSRASFERAAARAEEKLTAFHGLMERYASLPVDVLFDKVDSEMDLQDVFRSFLDCFSWHLGFSEYEDDEGEGDYAFSDWSSSWDIF